MNKTVAIYVRSNNVQERNRQKAVLCKLAEEKFNTEVIIYEELDVHTGSATDRPKLKLLLNNVQKGKHLIVLLKDLDRLSRNSDEKLSILNGIKASNISIMLEDSTVISSLTSENMEFLISYFQKAVKEAHSKKIKEGLSRRAQNGLYNRPLYGYIYENKQLVVNDRESKFVHRIFELRAEGKDFIYIKKFLHSNGVTTRCGNSFTCTGIKNILNNAVYAGFVKHRKIDNGNQVELIKGVHEPIVSKELWNKVQDKQVLKQISLFDTTTK